jgi:hypothetical protein
MHSSLAVTTEGLPLGLSAITFWTRSKFKGCTALKRHVNPTRVPIEEKESYRWLENMRESSALLGEPGRCIHVGDRESDIYELFCTAHDLGTHFLVRTCVDRLAGDGQHTIDGEMRNGRAKGLHRVELRDAKGVRLVVDLELRYQRMTVLRKRRVRAVENFLDKRLSVEQVRSGVGGEDQRGTVVDASRCFATFQGNSSSMRLA